MPMRDLEGRRVARPNATRKVTLYLTPDEHHKLKAECAWRDLSLTDLVLEALNSRVVFYDSSKMPPFPKESDK